MKRQSWKFTTIAIAISAVTTILLAQTSALRDLEYKVVETPFFHLREALGRSPTLSSKIRIFAYDDYSLGKLQKPAPSLGQFAAMIDAVAKQRPKIIFIDAVFRILDGTDAEREAFLRAIERSGVVVMGAYLSPKPTPTGSAILAKPYYRQDYYIPIDFSPLATASMTFTGPHSSLATKIFGVGHIQYLARHRIPAVLKLNAKQVLPSIALFESADPLASLRRLASDMDLRSELMVNFAPSMDYYSRTLPMYNLLNAALYNPHYLPEMVSAGDIVVMLPLMYSGNVDLTEGPFGPIPRGLALTSMLNSSLTGDWLFSRSMSLAPFFFVALCFAGLSLVQSNLRFLVASGGITAMHALLGYAFFATGSVVPWLGSAILSVTLTTAFIVYRFLAQSKQSAVLRQTLQGVLPSDKLQRFLKNPELLQRDPAEKFVTVMFIDIAGFSLRAKEGGARGTFDLLKAQLQILTALVHKHKGVVDKTLGDGMLAFFGYDYDRSFDGSQKNETFRNQADNAIRCAIDIQLTNARMGLEHPERAFFPLRIGINSDHVYIGDVGFDGRVEYTLIGDGVNMAQRFETACAHNSVLIGMDTMNRLQEMSEALPRLFHKLIKVKHHAALYEVFELDPFWNQKEERQKVEALFREQMGFHRSMDRLRLSSPVSVASDRGPGLIMDLSVGGLALVHDQYLGSHVDIRLKGTADFPFDLAAEVRWGVPYGDRFLLGLKFTTVQREDLDRLKSYVDAQCLESKRRCG